MYQFSLHQYFVNAVAISINKCFLLCCHFIISSFLSVAVVACFSCRFDFHYQFLTKFISLLSQPLSLSSSYPLSLLHTLTRWTNSPTHLESLPSLHTCTTSAFSSAWLQRQVLLQFFGQKWSLGVFLIKTSARSKKYLTPNFLWSRNLGSEKNTILSFFKASVQIFLSSQVFQSCQF